MIEEIAINNYQWNSRGRLAPKAAGVQEVSEVTALATQVETLNKKIDNLSVQKTAAVMAYDTCGGGHTALDCPIVGDPSRPKSK